MDTIDDPSRTTSGRRRRQKAGRASTLVGLTMLFGAAMTGQALSQPGNGNGNAGGNGQGNGPAEKVTICHATGSSTTPYVEITISVNGLNGHDGHDGDIIPAPPGGCPGPAGEDDKDKDKVTICHATGSSTNPYVVITISVNGLNGHDGHDGDIIPAPPGGCPVPTPTTTTPPTTLPPTTVPPTPTTPTTEPRSVAPTSPLPTSTPVPATESVVRPAVLGVTLEAPATLSTAAASPATPAAVLGASTSRTTGSLPRTGSEVTSLAMCGLGLLVLGAALKRGSRPARRTA